MIEVVVEINRRKEIVRVGAVRVKPTGRNPRQNEMCRYQMVIFGIYTKSHIDFPYGDGAGLAIEMLKWYKHYG